MAAGNELLHATKILKDAGLRPGMRVADFGIGRSAHFSLAASQIVGEKGCVYAIDIVPELLKILSGRCAIEGRVNVETMWADFEGFCGVPVRPGTLDMVFAIHLVWCINDFNAMAAEARRLLGEGGKLVVLDWYPESNHPAAPPKEKRIGQPEAHRRLLEAGFSKVSELKVSDNHWGLIAS